MKAARRFTGRSSMEAYTRRMMISTAVAALALATSPQGALTTHIDNPYWPMRPGARWVYAVTEGKDTGRTVTTVTRRTRTLADGTTVRVVTDVSHANGRLTERTKDYYAQDAEGTLWYFGEATTAYEPGRPPSTKGSWEAGVDGARPGIAMPARPRAGMRYRQELARGVAEDRGAIVATGEQADTPLRHFGRVVMTRDTNDLEPHSLEFKFYARGVGPVLALDVSGGAAREALIRRGR